MRKSGGNLQGLSTVNNRAYIASAQALQIIDAPLWKGRIANPTAPMQIAASTNNLYIASFQKVLYSYDTTNRANPLLLSSAYNLQGFARDMVITKDYLFIAEGTNGIEILNIHNPAQPLLVGQIKTGLRNARGLNLLGNRLHVADDTGGLVIFQIDIQPLIQTNQLFIFSSQTITLGLNNLNVIDPDNLASELIFTISSLTNAFFAKIPNNTTAILSFSLDDVINNQILITATGLSAPNYMVGVSDGLMSDGHYNALVFYNQSPILVNKTLPVSQGTSLLITTNNIDVLPAPNDMRSYNMTAMKITIDQINNAYFAFTQNTSQAITQFTEQDIVDGIVALIPDGTSNIPNISISINNGATILSQQALIIIFQGMPQVPRIVNKTFIFNEGEAKIITLDELCAFDLDTLSYSDTLLFSANSIGYGRFSRVNTTIILGQFYQRDIRLGNIQFISTSTSNSWASFFDISVATSFKSTNFTNGVVDFDPLAKIIQNTLTIGKGESVTITPAELQAIILVNANTPRAIYVPETNASLVYEMSQVSHGQFELIQNPGQAIYNFTDAQVQSGNTIRFVHDNSDIRPDYTVRVRGQRTVTANQSATVFFKSQQAANNTPIIAGGTAAGIAGLAGLVGLIGYFAKNYYEGETRKKHQFARYLRRHLGIGDVDNFNKGQGQEFTNLVELQLAAELRVHGRDVDSMNDQDIEDLAIDLAFIIKNNDYLIPSTIPCTNKINSLGRPTLDLIKLKDEGNIAKIVQDWLKPWNNEIDNTI